MYTPSRRDRLDAAVKVVAVLVLLKDFDIELTFPISPYVCLLARWARDLNVRKRW